jgi:hypothetical protein
MIEAHLVHHHISLLFSFLFQSDHDYRLNSALVQYCNSARYKKLLRNEKILNELSKFLEIFYLILFYKTIIS